MQYNHQTHMRMRDRSLGWCQTLKLSLHPIPPIQNSTYVPDEIRDTPGVPPTYPEHYGTHTY